MEWNCTRRDENGDAVLLLFVDPGEENSDDLIDKYKEVFSQPEVFLSTNSGLLVMPYVMDDFKSPGNGDRER